MGTPNREGTIVIIEDDADDQEILMTAFEELKYPNKLMFFANGYKALDYLNECKEKPFLIFSDINLPELNGLELRKKIHNNAQLISSASPIYFLQRLLRKKQ